LENAVLFVVDTSSVSYCHSAAGGCKAYQLALTNYFRWWTNASVIFML